MKSKTFLFAALLAGQCYQTDYVREAWEKPVTSRVILVGKNAYKVQHWSEKYRMFLGEDITQPMTWNGVKIPLKVVECPK